MVKTNQVFKFGSWQKICQIEASWLDSHHYMSLFSTHCTFKTYVLSNFDLAKSETKLSFKLKCVSRIDTFVSNGKHSKKIIKWIRLKHRTWENILCYIPTLHCGEASDGEQTVNQMSLWIRVCAPVCTLPNFLEPPACKRWNGRQLLVPVHCWHSLTPWLQLGQGVRGFICADNHFQSCLTLRAVKLKCVQSLAEELQLHFLLVFSLQFIPVDVKICCTCEGFHRDQH